LNGRWREADVLLQRFSQIDPDRKPVELARARSNAALGLPAAAVGLVRKIDSLYTAVLTRADRGFERVWTDPGFLAATDVPAMMARGLAQAEAEAAANSAKLGTVLSLMQALRRVGRHDDAIAAGERVLASDLSRFADRAAMEVWIHDEIARAAKAKGNFGLAESAYRNGIERIGDANPEVVNILINAAAFLAAEAGKYQEAIELSERAKKVGASAFGVMQANSAAIAACWGLGRSADLARIVAEMETDVEDNPSAAIEALLLLGRSGDAAAIVAAKPASPRHVDSMVLNLQRFTAKRPPSGAAARTVAAGWEAVRRDPKVLAALSKVGRVTDVPAASYY
jgi:tetratricopeptide (TPR) repeat protein